jgi:hypothetical protein
MYRTIDTEIWIDRKVKMLDTETKLLWVYLITNSHTHLSGLYYLPIPFIIHETGLTDKSVRRGLKALNETLMLHYDEINELVFVVKMLKRQKGINSKNNIWTSIVNQLRIFSHSPLIDLFLYEYNYLNIPFEVPIKSLDKDLAPVPNTVTGTVPVPDTVTVEAQEIGEEWFKHSTSTFKGIKITLDQQIKTADDLIKKYGLRELRKAIDFIYGNNFYAQNIRSLDKLNKHWEKRGRVWMLEVLDDANRQLIKPEYTERLDDPEVRARIKAENQRAAAEAR